jgi:hypothetical protein
MDLQEMDCEDGDELDWLRIHVQLQNLVLVSLNSVFLYQKVTFLGNIADCCDKQF